jgi:hypothetical protein
VLLVGDAGTGKTSMLQTAQLGSDSGVVRSAPVVCRFDSGALQNALLDGLADAISGVPQVSSKWKRLVDRLSEVTVDTATALGRELAKALTKELLEVVRARIGVNVGSSMAAAWRSLTTSRSDELRRDIRSRSDANVVRLIASLAEASAELLDTNIVLAIDEANRLSPDDQRILASLAVEAPQRVQIVAAWSIAIAESRPGIELLAETGCAIVEVGGLPREAVGEWLRVERVNNADTEGVYRLTGGYPLLVEGVIAHLRAGESIDDYTGPDVFVKVLDAALLRLSPQASSAARRLSAFTEPIDNDRIADYLGVTPVEWGTIRAGLEHERILTVSHGGQRWFHEMRRNHLWNDVMDDAERSQVADEALDALLAEHQRRGGGIDTGLTVPIASLAAHAKDHLAADPVLTAAVGFGRDDLAVVAAMMELSSDNEEFIAPADSVLIHARSTFGGADDLIDNLVRLVDSGFLKMRQRPIRPGESLVDTQRVEIADLSPAVEVVAHGRIQSILGRPAIPKVASLVARTHLEEMRQESTFMVIAAEEADTLDLIGWANMCRSPLYEPMLAARLRFGDQPISVSAIFNTNAERAAALAHLRAVDGARSAQRRLTVEKTLLGPGERVPSNLFLNSVWQATGVPVERNQTKWWLRTDMVLPIGEFARRRMDCLRLVRKAATDTEREAMELDLPVGIATADLGSLLYWIEFCGTEAVIEVDPAVAGEINNADPYLYSRLSVALKLTNGQRIRNFTVQTRGEPLVEDPVVDTLNGLWQKARRFNADQAPRRILFEEANLDQRIRATHIRISDIARTMSETLTVAGQRGHREQRSLNVAIQAVGDPQWWGGLATVAAYPIGDPGVTSVRLVDRRKFGSAEELYEYAFGAGADRTDFHGGRSCDMIASLLGHERDEIQLCPR